MTRKRRLSLSSESLHELTADDLRGVAAGAGALSDPYGRCTLDNSYAQCSYLCTLPC